MTFEVSVLQTVLFIAWLNMMIKTLPWALLNNQLNTIAAPMIWTASAHVTWSDQDQRQMQTAIRPRMSAVRKAVRPGWRRGTA